MNGILLATKTCLPCPRNTFVSAIDLYSCHPCPDSQMTVVAGVCNCANASLITSNGQCLQVDSVKKITTEFSTDQSTSVKYNDIVGSSAKTIQSDTFSKYFLSSAVLCQVLLTWPLYY